MKALLLDTHAFLWFVTDDPRLTDNAASLIADVGITKHISLASLWEIAIKSQLKRLNLGKDYDAFVQEYITTREVELIPIDLRHFSVYSSLPLHHRDPFDRMIIAQATALDLPIKRLYRVNVFSRQLYVVYLMAFSSGTVLRQTAQ